jgi:hypothetical protein
MGNSDQGFQMVYFQTKNPHWGIFGGPRSGKFGAVDEKFFNF